MQEITNYGKVFETLVRKTQDYIVGNNLSAMVLGISGGIDSTVVAAICHEVYKRTAIPLIGRSLPTKYNKEGEVVAAQLVGKAFCNDFEEVPIKNPYESFLSLLDRAECGMTPIANGNIQARLRMIYLYHLASIKGGLVMDTDNLTENNLGYFTIHGDVGDFNPIGGLWKTEVFKLAEWLLSYYSFQLPHNMYEATSEQLEKSGKIFQQGRAMKESLKLKPTAGLGITNNDLEEIGAESYDQIDTILQRLVSWRSRERDMFQTISTQCKCFLEEHNIQDIPSEIIEAVTKRHFASEFKRRQLPIKITRDEILV